MNSTQQGVGISGVGQIAVIVRDTERAVKFYRDRVGLRLLFRAGRMAFFDCGGVRLMLSPPEGAEFDHASSVLYFTVSDLGGAREAMVERGVGFRDEPHKIADLGAKELWMTFFDDTEGNVMALMSEVPKA